MKITASQAVRTTAKLNKVDKQVTLIGQNLVSGKYKTIEDFQKVRASLRNAYVISKRACDQVYDSVESVEDLKEMSSNDVGEKLDETLEASLNVATKASIFHKAVENALEELGEEDEILDDEGSEVIASEGIDDEIMDEEIEEEEGEFNETQASSMDEELVEDDEELVEDDEIEENEPIVSKKSAAQIKKASVVKRKASSGLADLSKLWSFPSLRRK